MYVLEFMNVCILEKYDSLSGAVPAPVVVIFNG
jgi:hypothetical protein